MSFSLSFCFSFSFCSDFFFFFSPSQPTLTDMTSNHLFNNPQSSHSDRTYTFVRQEERQQQWWHQGATGQTRQQYGNSSSSSSNNNNNKNKATYFVNNTEKRREPFLSIWALEFVALFISIGSLVSAAVVLSRFDGRRLEEWEFGPGGGGGYLGVSLNTLISLLGVISKASLAFVLSQAISQHKWNWFRTREDKLRAFEKFDQGSRGPWGSLNLLLWSRGM